MAEQGHPLTPGSDLAAIQVRPGTEADLPGLTAIYNQVIATSTAVFSDTPSTVEERRAWMLARQAQGYPVLVAAEDGAVAGFASFGDFRPWPGYRYTIEHSVHVAEGRRGQGIGRRLLEALLPLASDLGKQVMVAGVDADNLASIRLHQRLGFELVGRLPGVGYKFGRFLDLVFLQRRLNGAG